MTTVDISSPAVAGPVVALTDVTKRYRRGAIAAVSDVDLTVGARRIVALVGESGSGKSTLGRMVVGLLDPTSGDVRVDAEPVVPVKRRRRARPRRAQMVFQDVYGSLNPSQDIGRQIEEAFLSSHPGSSRAAARARAAALLARVGLDPDLYAARRPDDLSGGQRQRVGIARALAGDPSVVIADEPISMLDVSIRRDVLDLLVGLRDDEGVSVLYITHDLLSAGYVADDIVVLFRGMVVEQGPAREVLARPRHPYSRLLAGSSPGLGQEERARVFLEAPRPRTPWNGEGCPFAPRCPFAQELCRTALPPLTVTGRAGDAATAAARCHRLEELDALVATREEEADR